MEELHRIGTLWIGERLSFLEHLCLKSFVDHGHDLTLFAFGPVANVPEGVRIRPASEILPESEAPSSGFSSKEAAIFADRFRVRMVRETDMVWVDCDVFCLRPFVRTSGHVFGYETHRKVSNAVLGAPKSSPALAMLDEVLSNDGVPPAWWSEDLAKEHFAEYGQYRFVDMKWGATGPWPLSWCLAETGEIAHAQQPRVFHVPASKRRGYVFRKAERVERELGDGSMSLHFYGTSMKRLFSTGEIPPVSFLARLAQKHDVPLPASPAEFGATS